MKIQNRNLLVITKTTIQASPVSEALDYDNFIEVDFNKIITRGNLCIMPSSAFNGFKIIFEPYLQSLLKNEVVLNRIRIIIPIKSRIYI